MKLTLRAESIHGTKLNPSASSAFLYHIHSPKQTEPGRADNQAGFFLAPKRIDMGKSLKITTQVELYRL